MKKFSSTFFCCCIAIAIWGQAGSEGPRNHLKDLFERINVAGQAALAMPTEHDFTYYEFDWNINTMAWDSSAYTTAYAVNENGQTNLYLNTFWYDEDALQFAPQEFAIIYGVKTPLGVDLNFIDESGTFFADSLISYIYDEEALEFIPFIFGYLTPHPTNGKLHTLEFYLNSTGASKPPFILLPFILQRFHYDVLDRLVAFASTELDIFDLTFYQDSTSLILNKDDQLIEEFYYQNDTLQTYSQYTYEPGAGFPATQVSCYYDAGTLYLKDSVVIDIQSPEARIEYQYQWIGGSPFGYRLTGFTTIATPNDTVMVSTYHQVQDGSPPHATFQERRSYDDQGRISRVLEKTDWPFDTLLNSQLTIYNYPMISSVGEIVQQEPKVRYRLNDRQLDIVFDQAFEGRMAIYTADGVPVYLRTVGTAISDASISLRNLPAGIYFVRLDSKQIRKTFGIALL